MADDNSENSSLRQRSVKEANSPDQSATEPDSTQADPPSGDGETPVNPRFGPMPNVKSLRLWTRMVLVVGSLVVVYFTATDERFFARQKEVLDHRKQNVPCSESYREDIYKFPGCVPANCGRAIMDRLITAEEADGLKALAVRTLALGGSSGGASILDLHSGALSQGDAFVDLYSLPGASISPKDFELYRRVKNKIQAAVAHSFALSPSALHLTHPTFFSRLTSANPVTQHDEYWHKHVDKETYKSFHYTSLLYLSDYSYEFKGGRFMFLEAGNISLVIEPKKGRVSMFTSGAENVHWVERVKSGVRYALTVSFTCDKKQGIEDPKLPDGSIIDTEENLPDDLTGNEPKGEEEIDSHTDL